MARPPSRSSAYWTTSSPARSNGHGGIVSQRANRAYARFARVRLTRWSATMRISARGAFRQWLNKLGLDVPGKWSTRHNRRPKFQRRGLDQTTVERHHVQVVVQKGPASTVTSVTGQPYSGSTLTPMADTTDVRARRIGEEDIGALVPTLGFALESPTSSRERGKVGIVIYRHQHVGIFRIMLVSDQRPDESNSSHTGTTASVLDEPHDFRKQEAPNRLIVNHARHHVRCVRWYLNVHVDPAAVSECEPAVCSTAKLASPMAIVRRLLEGDLASEQIDRLMTSLPTLSTHAQQPARVALIEGMRETH